MKKVILAILLLACLALIAASCTPKNDLPLKTDENGNVVTNEKGDPIKVDEDEGENNNGGGIQVGVEDDETGWGELIPVN